MPVGLARSPAAQKPGKRVSRQRRAMLKAWVQAVLVFLGIALVSTLFRSTFSATPDHRPYEHQAARALAEPKARTGSRTLVSYSYFEKDPGQMHNFEFFQAVGMGHRSTFKAPADTDFVVVISGDVCTPCASLYALLAEDRDAKRLPQLTSGSSRPGLALLQRGVNEGMDFAAHNVTIEWVRMKGTAKAYRYFIFLNSSVRGPFYPSYMPPDWQWTQAYTARLTHSIKVVSSSIVCLPHLDAGGYGAKAESWAFGTDFEGLQVLAQEGVFHLRLCKLCDDGVVVKGEYGLTTALFAHGFNIATLMGMYPPDLDWRDQRHWNCNNNVHPSRHGTYDGIAMHPYEVVFLKASWHVGEPHLSHYTKWVTAHANGEPGTQGSFDEPMYRYGVSLEAQEPNKAAEGFKVI